MPANIFEAAKLAVFHCCLPPIRSLLIVRDQEMLYPIPLQFSSGLANGCTTSPHYSRASAVKTIKSLWRVSVTSVPTMKHLPTVYTTLLYTVLGWIL